MEDATDTVFRQMLVKFGSPDVFFTEFTSVDGLLSKGKNIVSQRLRFTKKEHPIVGQIWGNNPQNFAAVTNMLVSMGFDGIDINMGCPDRDVMKKECGARLIENHTLAREIISAVKKEAKNLPISIKTRLGVKTVQTKDWINFLLTLPIDAIIIHGRTAKELSKVPAHWEEIGSAVYIRNQKKSQTLIIGNGDVSSFDDAQKKATQYGVDGVMIGRAMFDNPWIFNNKIDPAKIPLEEKLAYLLTHLRLFQKTWGKEKYFGSLKKLYKMYIANTPGASELRSKLVRLGTIEETVSYLEKCFL